MTNAIQDYCQDNFAHCYGCGRLNPVGYQLNTRWDGDGTASVLQPRPRTT